MTMATTQKIKKLLVSKVATKGFWGQLLDSQQVMVTNELLKDFSDDKKSPLKLR